MNNYFLLDYKIYRIIYRILKLEFKDIEYNKELKKNELIIYEEQN